jgi:cytochrome c
VALDDVDGFLQGCAFRFAAGLPEKIVALHSAIPNAIVAWFDVSRQPASTRRNALCFMRQNERVTFEMYAVRAMTNGFEIEFTKPLDPRGGWEPESYYVEQWPFKIGSDEGNKSEPEAQARAHPPRRDGIRYPVKSASVSADRKRVFLEIENLKESHVVYIRLLPPCYSKDGERPWSTEAWYTLNVIPRERHGEVLTPPEPEPRNFLTAEEKAAGWKLLFDGQTTAGWRAYRKDHMPDGWQVEDGCLVRLGPGGDIITAGEFDNFELKFEWRICAAGNSGVFYRVNEDLDWPFFTGPEFQVLDNAEHADGRNSLTSAGSNYALHAPVRDTTALVGFFNQVRIVCDGPHVEHWLNGVKIVEYELWTDEWKQMVADSKFKAWPNYGLMKQGHIVLQDHGDQVWYRNIKIRALGGE